MKLFGKARCKWFGCGPHTRHQLDAEIDLYVCDSCGAGVMDAPANIQEVRMGGLVKSAKVAGHVWYDAIRDEARVRL